MAAHACLKNEFTEGDKCHNRVSRLISLKLGNLLSRPMRLWRLSSSVNSIFKHACTAIHWDYTSDFLVRPFIYFHTLCVRTAKALARLRGCAVSLEPSLVACVISIIISWAGSFYYCIAWIIQSAYNMSRLMTKPTKCMTKPKNGLCEDSGQPGRAPNLIGVLAVRMRKAWVLSYLLSAQRRLWSNWEDAQGIRPVWSVSSLGAHAILLVLSRCGSYTFQFAHHDRSAAES